MLNAYETIFVVDCALDEEKRNEVIEKFTELIKSNGEIESVDEWGVRKLAYLIDYKKEGYYVLVNFKAEADFPSELERIYKINDSIIRSIVVRK